MFLIHIQDIQDGTYTIQFYETLEEIAAEFKRCKGPLAGPGDRCSIHEIAPESGDNETMVIADLKPYYGADHAKSREERPDHIATYTSHKDPWTSERGFTLHSDDKRIKQLFS